MLHVCSNCNYQTHYKSNLVRHMKTKHENKAQITNPVGIAEGQAHTPNHQLVSQIKAPSSIQLHQHVQDQQQQANVNIGTEGSEAQTPNHQLVSEIKASSSIQLHQDVQDLQQQANVNMGTEGSQA